MNITIYIGEKRSRKTSDLFNLTRQWLSNNGFQWGERKPLVHSPEGVELSCDLARRRIPLGDTKKLEVVLDLFALQEVESKRNGIPMEGNKRKKKGLPVNFWK